MPAKSGAAIALIDPSRLRRECLRLAMLHHSPERIITEAGSADELLQLADGGNRFDLLLICAATADHIDLRQIETLRHHLPDTPIVAVAETDNPQRARQVLSTGARGFLPTSLSLRVLIGAIDLVLAGGVYVPSSLIEGGSANRASTWSDQPATVEPWSGLTRRQRDVLALISQGKSNKLIADALSMSESTVKAHVKQIIKRLNVANRTQAALVATGRGMFPHQPYAGNGSAEAAAPK
ncbi:MAG TPA: response regulator transcription factor [Stellaceae bacterium]|nr:response regulator transcription factor [Stellaceae bacterium]